MCAEHAKDMEPDGTSPGGASAPSTSTCQTALSGASHHPDRNEDVIPGSNMRPAPGLEVTPRDHLSSAIDVAVATVRIGRSLPEPTLRVNIP